MAENRKAELEGLSKEALVALVLEMESSAQQASTSRKRPRDATNQTPDGSANSTAAGSDESGERAAKRPKTAGPPQACPAQPAGKKQKRKKEFDLSQHSVRNMAFRLAYLGWNYCGNASQGSANLNTVEAVLFKALMKSKLIAADATPATVSMTRCGRTDKGVSAFGNVVSLHVRSNLKEGVGMVRVGAKHLAPEASAAGAAPTTGAAPAQPKQPKPSDKPVEEIDYVHILNSLLPEDIRILGATPVSLNFNARFQCKWRQYKYFFVKEQLDVEAMRKALGHFLGGPHDFRNFCKMDAKQVSNFVRQIYSFEILPVDDGYSDDSETKTYVMVIKGTAFLYHQVRCMAAVLFLVGQGREDPQIVAQLLDLATYPRKPVYPIAPDYPLVLYDCSFEGLEFLNPSRNHHSIVEHVQEFWRERAIKLRLVDTMRLGLFGRAVEAAADSRPIYASLRTEMVNDRVLKQKYNPLRNRDTESTYEERIKEMESKGKSPRGEEEEGEDDELPPAKSSASNPTPDPMKVD